MNSQDPNKMTDKELSQWLGEVLQKPDRCLNCGNVKVPALGTLSCLSAVSVENPQGWVDEGHLCLDVMSNPLSLNDWNVAMKWRDWAVAEYKYEVYRKALTDVFFSENYPIITSFDKFLVCLIQPKDYLTAAAKLKEKQNEQ